MVKKQCYTKKTKAGASYTTCLESQTKPKTIKITRKKKKVVKKVVAPKAGKKQCYTKKTKAGGSYTTCLESQAKPKTVKITRKKKKVVKKVVAPKPTAKGIKTIQKKIKTTRKLTNKSTIKPPLAKSKVKPRASTKSYFQLYKDTEKALVKSRLYAWNHRSPYDKGRNSTSGDFADTDAGLKKAIAFRKKVLTKVKKMKAGVFDILDQYNKEHQRVVKFAAKRADSSLHFDIENKLITSAEAFIRLNSWEKYDKYTDTDAHMFHHKPRIISIVRMKTNKFAKKGDLAYMKQNGPNGSWSVVDRPWGQTTFSQR